MRVFVCVGGTSRSRVAPIVSCEMQGSGVAGNRQRLRRCAAPGGSTLWWWPERLFSWPTQLAVAEAPFCHCWLWVGVFPLAPSLLLLLPLFQHWLRNRGVRGHEGLDDGEGGGVYLGNGDLFVCTRAEYPSPIFFFFLFSSYYVSPPPTLSLLLTPQWGPIPLSDGPGQWQWPWLWQRNKVAQTCHGVTALTLPFHKQALQQPGSTRAK